MRPFLRCLVCQALGDLVLRQLDLEQRPPMRGATPTEHVGSDRTVHELRHGSKEVLVRFEDFRAATGLDHHAIVAPSLLVVRPDLNT